jgi:hypothetical protein
MRDPLGSEIERGKGGAGLLRGYLGQLVPGSAQWLALFFFFFFFFVLKLFLFFVFSFV